MARGQGRSAAVPIRRSLLNEGPSSSLPHGCDRPTSTYHRCLHHKPGLVFAACFGCCDRGYGCRLPAHRTASFFCDPIAPHNDRYCRSHPARTRRIVSAPAARRRGQAESFVWNYLKVTARLCCRSKSSRSKNPASCTRPFTPCVSSSTNSPAPTAIATPRPLSTR